MAWIKIRSNVTGKISEVSESAYNSFFKNMSIYTIIENKKEKEANPKPIVKEEVKSAVDEKPCQETASAKPIKPIKPLKAKADINDISEEV